MKFSKKNGLNGTDHGIDPGLYREVSLFGARDMEKCMQCGNCSASCPLSQGEDTFPRKIYRYLQLGLRQKLLSSPVPWLCYYCGECNKDCPRGAEPAETMMAARRWLTTQYDWTGLARKLYLSEAWEIGSLAVVSLFIILLFVFFHGPVITDRMAVNTFAPVLWIEIGDLLMAVVLSAFLLSNAFRMFRFIMAGTRVPLWMYITEAKSFVLHFATQKRWRKCSDDKTRWKKHFFLVTGYMTMMTLIIGCIRWFQVDDTSWHFTSIFGYYATAVLLYLTVDMMISRRKKEELIHRFSEPTDWLFLILLFATTLTGIFMHIVRLAGWPMGTYVMYVIHLAIAVPMLVIEVPFGKWSHLFYRPLAIFLSTVKEKADKESPVDIETMKTTVGETFLECMQCGTCTGSCPVNLAGGYSPRSVMRRINMDSGTAFSLDEAVWQCVTCNACTINCPRGINLVDVTKAVRRINAGTEKLPDYAGRPLSSLAQNNNPWNGRHEERLSWAVGQDIPEAGPDRDYCLFTCCTTAYGSGNISPQASARILPKLLQQAGVSFGTLGSEEVCCGDPADVFGHFELFEQLRDKNTQSFSGRGVQSVLTTSPHCFNTFKNNYPGLDQQMSIEHYTQLLERLIESGKLVPTQVIDQIVTYHDPCYLGRHNGIFDAPRNILKRIPGLTLVEMADSRERSLCCGGGGGHAWEMPPGRQDLSRLRAEQALSTGAHIIATACPFCVYMLENAVRKMGAAGQIRVLDLAEIVYESVGGDEKMKIKRIDQEVCHE